MRPWQLVDKAETELEALQTDVMRFVAILGLCLAAIFSLVQSASLEQEQRAAAPGKAGAEPPVKPLLAPAVESLQTPQQVPAPQTVSAPPLPAPPLRLRPDTSREAVMETVAPEQVAKPALTESSRSERDIQDGYTLEFESEAVLLQLLGSGRVTILARSGDSFWIAEGSGSFSKQNPTTAFYAMDSSTVPAVLRATLAATVSAAAEEWGVVLPPRLATELKGYAGRGGSGALVIQADGSLRLDTASVQEESAQATRIR